MKLLLMCRQAATYCCAILLVAFVPGLQGASTNENSGEQFTFIAAGDMRNYISSPTKGKRYFDGLCQAAHEIGPGAFMISPGDCDAPVAIRATIDKFLGTNFLWYPVVGNHDVESLSDLSWLHQWASNGIPYLIQCGPTGCDFTYSFDFGNCHFAAVSEYDGRNPKSVGKADITEATLAWLENDLAANTKPVVFVFGHNPIKSFPDMDSGRVRHGEDSVSTNPEHFARFIKILHEHHVCAYICGHTHDTSVEKVMGIWQTDSGHARGAGDPGSPSTFLKFRINGTNAWVDIYRGDVNGVRYTLRKTVALN